jgi:hypothetical protein
LLVATAVEDETAYPSRGLGLGVGVTGSSAWAVGVGARGASTSVVRELHPMSKQQSRTTS